MLEMKLTIDVIGLDGLTAALNRLADRQPTVVNEGTLKVDMSDVKEEPKKAAKKKTTKRAASRPEPVEEEEEEEKEAPAEEKKETPAPVEEKKDVPNPFAAAAPAESKREYTYEEIARAGSALVDNGKLTEVMELFGKFGVRALNQIEPAKFAEFAEELKKLGATF